MDLKFITTLLQVTVDSEKQRIIHAYKTNSDETKNLCMIDLANSTNYRIVRGPLPGYLRGVTFLTIVRNVISHSSKVRLLKEMGDAVLLMSDDIRPLFESVILIQKIVNDMKATQPEEQFPFEIRSGFTHGIVKRILDRSSEDYLGKPIDLLSRIMNERSLTSNIYLQEESYRHNIDVLQEYGSFAEYSIPKKVSPGSSKNTLIDITYRETIINWEQFLNFDDFFNDWKKMPDNFHFNQNNTETI